MTNEQAQKFDRLTKAAAYLSAVQSISSAANTLKHVDPETALKLFALSAVLHTEGKKHL